VPDISARVDFLKKMHLFRGLSNEQLKSVAEELQEQFYSEPDTVFIQGAPADALYIIYQGRVGVTRRVADKQLKLGMLMRGDYFGEQGLLTSRSRSATIQAERGTLLLILYRDHFRNLLRKVPGLRSNFQIMIASRELARRLRFKWLADNEIIYFITRKHPILLAKSLFLPVVALLVILGVLALALAWNSATFGAVGAFAFVLDLAWGLWSYVDWENDFYIVTNQRVIWMEKVIALYDSRTEANMSTILSVSMETDQIGRLFDYGTVVVRTFTGQIRMAYIPSPKQAAAMIEEYWMRTKDNVRQSEQDGIKQAIRSKLGLAPLKTAAPPPPAAPKPEKRSIQLRELWQSAFKMRVEEGGIVTYHKHVYVLLRDTWIQNAVFLFLLSAPFLWSIYFGAIPPLWFFGVLILAVAIDTVMWIYEYLDWSNDIYQVTAEQIIDINRKPFGTEDRKAAPLENILSTEYKRTGFIGMLLNFGTVYIMVGGAQFNFEDVADPPVVQQDIVRRQQARVYKKREAETAGERERLAEWLAMYHRTVEEIEREQNPSEPKNPE
jgi:hypothetical protein